MNTFYLLSGDGPSHIAVDRQPRGHVALDRLVGGRSDVPGDVVIEGDEAVGNAIVDQLGFMP